LPTFDSTIPFLVVGYSIGLEKISKVRYLPLRIPPLVTSFTGIDSSLSDNFGRSIMYGLSALTTVVTVSVVGGLPFIVAMCLLGVVYYNGKQY
jgi:hypothetical protein